MDKTGNTNFKIYRVIIDEHNTTENTSSDSIKRSSLPKKLCDEPITTIRVKNENEFGLPSGFEPFKNKVAGHNKIARHNDVEQILKYEGTIWKLMKTDQPKDNNELSIYESMLNRSIAKTNNFEKIFKHVATCNGIGFIGKYCHLILDDLCHNFEHPSTWLY